MKFLQYFTQVSNILSLANTEFYFNHTVLSVKIKWWENFRSLFIKMFFIEIQQIKSRLKERFLLYILLYEI